MSNFSDIQKLMDESLEKNLVPCSDVMISYQGDTVFRYFNGFKDEKKQIPLQGNELYFLYSATKVITCTAAMQLYERGRLKLDEEVSAYLPEWKKKTQTPLTIRHLMTMTSGLDYSHDHPAILKQVEKNRNSSTRDIVKAMAQMPLNFEPGTHFQYGLNHDVLAAVIEEIAECSFGEYLKKNIFDVCGMESTGFALTDERKSRLCCQYQWNVQKQCPEVTEQSNYLVMTPAYESGGAGLISCTEDYDRFAKKMVNGKELLKKETMDLMRRNQLHGQAYLDFQNVKKGYGYGLGVRTEALKEGPVSGEFGWDGAAGSYVMLDPENSLSIFYATHVLAHGEYLYEKLHPTIKQIAYEALKIK